jgi:peptidoglycan/LPS O-acetylase OafA/YrhL
MATDTGATTPRPWQRMAPLALGLAAVLVALLYVLALYAPPDMGTFFLLLAVIPLLPGVLVAKVARLRSSMVVLSVVLTWVLAVAGEVLVTGALPLPGFSGYGIGLAVGPLLAIAIAGRRTPTTGSDQPSQVGARHP